ncbi:FAD-dependent monooxygenase [Achromobacter sp. Marseille-Q0513]|uniref:FAD-dependent oxidoreductase n=1 Tax=Achromobacter sp. Marseille-Q0513 TaxID=2829161 RepID=UPI001B8EB7D7|nr:FAD-dependent monooxygenase [Achromobacter sp. Marseille-Q0513]MBR8655684.1 FAD-dependent monooxygenase [Achromobacter sp. Marseille-Q0513]
MPIKHVAIVGAGIGGLAAALAIRQAGLSVSVYDQASRLEPLGASLTLWPNAMRCLRALGVAEPLLRAGARILSTEARSLRGEMLACVPMQRFYDEAGEPGICVTRADVQRVLLDALGAEHVTLSRRLESLSQDAGGVALRFRDGAEARADLLIGADGLRSTVRRLLFDDGPPRYAGYGAWLGLSAIDHPRLARESAVEVYGAGERLGVIDSGGGLYYWYFIENRAQPVDGVVHCTSGSLLPRLVDWPDYARQLAMSTRARSLQYLSFFHRSARRGPWGQDRALLLGDAIHPYLPNLGQGACQAIEDAHVLGIMLAQGLEDQSLLTRYQSARARRTAMLGRDSVRLGRFAQVGGPTSSRLRDLALRSVPDWVHARRTRQQFGIGETR